MPPTPNLYGFPDMGRTGLAHSLLAWGRCAVWCRDTGATMLAPRWLRLRVGPYLRRERDKRNYFRTFHSGPLLWEPRRSLIRATAQTLFAELDLPAPGYAPAKPVVVVFRNAQAQNSRKFFHLLAGEGLFLRDQLVKITRRNYLPSPPPGAHVAIHIRLGDFGIVPDAEIRDGATNARLSLDWYGRVLDRLRIDLGCSIPAIVYSDGSDQDLAPILSRQDVTRAPQSAAVTDLLAISRASVLIASASGFSQWGAFLGSVPYISYTGQNFFDHIPELDRGVETDGNGALPQEFLTIAARRLESTLP